MDGPILYFSSPADKDDDCFDENQDFEMTDSLVDLSIFGDDTLLDPNCTDVSNATAPCDRAIPSKWGIDDKFKCQVRN